MGVDVCGFCVIEACGGDTNGGWLMMQSRRCMEKVS